MINWETIVGYSNKIMPPFSLQKIAKEWFTNKNVTVFQWPAKSPDLNIIGNVWGHLSRVLYENGKQYDSLNELENAIFRHWATIPKTYIKSCMVRFLREFLK